ncbi:RAMP superfamily CRISPR-associated protein [Nostoc sp. TCL26-01]|uniref:RAMP superfamily CRISPR-associated protein n=1 Tax=Nostoc sp. TCL26-01 TaxID=2576904 RepID=UPI0015BA5B9C|nr:RAMP superfamily CRISPR-associated protein [Nostoc sp. TCL26-01]QLE57414.1 CRISPR-associated protein Cmr6 [Nostoc sp. TCL26-01]
MVWYQEEWTKLLEKLKKQKPQPPAIYQIIKDSSLVAVDNTSITLLFPDEEQQKKAKANIQKILNILPDMLKRQRVNCLVQTSGVTKIMNPLQELKHTLSDDESGKTILKAAIDADSTCEELYKYLADKTSRLANEILDVSFPWRLRVGGMRGFKELLLPALHPVYGIPYVPASSLKGAVKAWAKDEAELDRLLGTLDNGIGCVQIFDAFPTAPCLNMDITNPQWHGNQNLQYQPVPHHFISMQQPHLRIGLAKTKRGSLQDVQTVKQWLIEALKVGIGSRVSAGYGRSEFCTSLPHASQHQFQLWTQGIHGADTNNSEFRPVALRGVLRYWFRAVALGIYSLRECKKLEDTFFGTIEPKSHRGSISINVELNKKVTEKNRPDEYHGTILLEAKSASHLKLIQKLLQLTSHISGIGKGSRRPLHWNHPRFRGCYWEISGMQLPYNQEDWQRLLQDLREYFISIQSPQDSPAVGDPGSVRNRYQDVLNQKAAIYLVRSPALKHPKDVRNWLQEGNKPHVHGTALETLYNSGYKGVNRQGDGNAEVGGNLGTPSFVIIKSNFPLPNQGYQTVTIFGLDNKKRAAFIRTLENENEVIKVFP